MSRSEITPRLWLDCSATLRYDGGTGIQRVVRNIVSAAVSMNSNGPQCVPVRFTPTAGFQVAAPPRLQPGPPRERGRAWRTARRLLDTFGLKHATHRQFVRFGGGVANLRRRVQSAERCPIDSRDSLLLLDASWISPYWGDVAALRRRGVRVGAVVYDLLPLIQPGDFPPHIRLPFERWWDQARRNIDYCVTISEQVARDVRDRLPAGVDIPVRSFRLGADLDTAAPAGDDADETVSEGVRTAMCGAPAVLMVGTLNPRKDHATAVAAMDLLWKTGSPIRLVILGRFGWGSDRLVALLRSHAKQGHRLFWFDNATDADLDFAYRRAAALVSASTAEGFNLPLVESLHRGRSVIATDLPVHREVAGRYAAYFPPGDASALARLVAASAADGLPNIADPAGFYWPGWRESCAELIAAAS